MARVTATVATFNFGRTSENGFYAISIATPYRRYYALWRIFTDERPPLFIRTLADTFVMAAGKAMDLLKYCKVTLKWVDNTFFIPYYEQTYDTLTFGKYRGKRIAEVYYIDPNYVLWMANRFEPEKKKLLKLKETAQCFAVVHAELSPPRRPAYRSPSRYVGEKGEKLEALRLKILYVKQQVDTYKPDFYIDQRILAADSQGNRYTFTEKAAGRSQTPKALSCFSRQLLPGMEITLSARVMGHYESQGVKYTRLGYVKYS
uniref:exodeoxyribonuclease X C-terminal domain-containing protein n=1 Tax=Paraprevotella clara TaxID=454154 RepID=UPI003FF07FB4